MKLKDLMLEVFKGPLGSHLNYIQYIVLENCLDYLNLIKEQDELGKNKIPDKYKSLRYFLNAIESVNNIPEYYFHENKNEINMDFNVYLGAVRSKYKIFREAEEISNAYKHCIRRKHNKKHAKDLQSPKLKIDVHLKSLSSEVEYIFESIENGKLIGEIYKFLIEYINSSDKNYFKI